MKGSLEEGRGGIGLGRAWVGFKDTQEMPGSNHCGFSVQEDNGPEIDVQKAMVWRSKVAMWSLRGAVW